MATITDSTEIILTMKNSNIPETIKYLVINGGITDTNTTIKIGIKTNLVNFKIDKSTKGLRIHSLKSNAKTEIKILT